MKKVSLSEFEKMNIPLSTWGVEYIQYNKKLSEELSPYIKTDVIISLEGDDPSDYGLHSCEVVAIDYPVKFGKYKDKYTIHSTNKIGDFNEWEYKKEFTDQPPKNIGVLSKKKIFEWIEYLGKSDQVKKKLSEQTTDKVETFLKSLEGLNVHWHDKTSGYIVKGGLIYSFSINRGIISESIKLHYSTPNTLQSFLNITK